MAVPADSTILAVQTEVGLEDLAAEDDEGFSADTVVALEQYASKVSSQSLAAHQLPWPCPNCHLCSGQTASAGPWPGHSLSPAPPPGSSFTSSSRTCIQPGRPCRQLFTLSLVYAASARGGSCEQQ